MLKKLYRHELCALYRILLPAYAIVLGMSLVTRMSFLLKGDLIWFMEASRWTMVFLSMASVYALMIAHVVVAILRFYKHLLSKEGYLTFSLPVSTASHLLAKLLGALTTSLSGLIVSFLSLLVMVLGTDLWQELTGLLPAIVLFFQTAFLNVGPVHVILYTIEGLLAVLLASACSLLMFYACMAIGQQFRNRVGGAILTYIGISFAGRILASFSFFPISMVILSSLDVAWLEQHARGAAHATLWIAILIIGVIAYAYWAITHHILSKKLNLE